MTILGIETATAICSAALVTETGPLAERAVQVPQMHSERLLPLIDDCFFAAGLAMDRIDGIAVSIGPGSFTGLRIGLSVAKGLAYASGKPLAGVSTLEALAHRAFAGEGAGTAAVVVPMIDARRDEVYAAVYRREGDRCLEVKPPQVVRLAELESFLPSSDHIIVAGDGAEKAAQSAGGRLPRVSFRSDLTVTAGAVATLGLGQLLRGEAADVADLDPLYLKEFFTTMKPNLEIR